MKNTVIKPLSLVIALIVAFAALSVPFSAAPEGLTAQAYVIMDADTGQVLAEKDMDKQLYPASITKIMTVLLAVENANPETVITVSETATVLDKPESSDSSHIALTSGEQIRMEDLMYATMVESANDAANCIAESVAGDIASFATLMNKRAAELGAKNTVFTNANGLPDESHLTTAYDMAVMTKYAITNPKFLQIFSTVIYNIPPDNKKESVLTVSTGLSMMKSTDPLYYQGIIGGKTGYTVPAGYTGVAVAQRGETKLIAVVFGSTSGANRFADLTALLDYGFNNFIKTEISSAAVRPTVSQVVENNMIVATVAISPSSGMYYLRHSSVPETDVTFTMNVKQTYSWYDIDPTVTVSAPENGYMYAAVGSFPLMHSEKQLTNPIAVTKTDDPVTDEEPQSPQPEAKPMSAGLKVFLIILAVVLIIIGGGVILFFVSNMRRRKRDKMRRLRRQEMYEQSRRERLAAEEDRKKSDKY